MGVRRARAALISILLILPLGAASPAVAGPRWYGVRTENSFGNYRGAQHGIYHSTVGSMTSASNVKMDCANNSAGEANMVLVNLWSIWRIGTPGVNGRWMEMAGEYLCGSGGVRTRRIRYEYYYDRSGGIFYYANMTDSGVIHQYQIVHHHPDDAKRWYWKLDGVTVSQLQFTQSAPHATYVQSGLEISNNAGILVEHHSYNGEKYKTADSTQSWASASWDASATSWPPVGSHAPDGRSLHACAQKSKTCH